MPYSQKKNPVKMMKSALHMYKAEKKQGMHRDSAMYMNHSPMEMGHSPMEMGHSPMEMGHESPAKNASKYGIQGVDELKYMPIVDDMHRKGDSPAKAAKPDFLDLDKDGDKTEPMKEAAKGSPAKKEGGKTKHGYLGSLKKYNKHIESQQHHTDPDAPRSEQDPTNPENPVGVRGVKKRGSKGSPATRQGYDDRLDESLAKDGKESSKKQSLKDRRDESKGMEKSKGKGAYSSDPKMS